MSIHPSSVLHGRKPRCIVFDELLRTTRSYARNVTVVEPSWLPEAAPVYFHEQEWEPLNLACSVGLALWALQNKVDLLRSKLHVL